MTDTDNPITLKCHIAELRREIERERVDGDLRAAKGMLLGVLIGMALWAALAMASCS